MCREGKVQRSFMPGDQWLYYKLYMGPKTSDLILTEVIKPIVEELQAKNVISKWFFIRFSDPDNHLRIRFLVNERNQFGELIQLLQIAFQSYLDEDQIWKIQIDTYHRELERYGFENIELAESLFSIESNTVVDLLPVLESDDKLRWQIVLLLIDHLLNSFNFSLELKNNFLLSLNEAFSKEFGMDKPLKVQLDRKFREERKRITEILEDKDRTNEALLYCRKVIVKSNSELRGIAREILSKNDLNQLNVSFTSLIRSYIHMLCNRYFITKPREHELVAYYLLSKYYQSSLAIQKQKETSLLQV